jgi:hypothetical protein
MSASSDEETCNPSDKENNVFPSILSVLPSDICFSPERKLLPETEPLCTLNSQSVQPRTFTVFRRLYEIADSSGDSDSSWISYTSFENNSSEKEHFVVDSSDIDEDYEQSTKTMYNRMRSRRSSQSFTVASLEQENDAMIDNSEEEVASDSDLSSDDGEEETVICSYGKMDHVYTLDISELETANREEDSASLLTNTTATLCSFPNEIVAERPSLPPTVHESFLNIDQSCCVKRRPTLTYLDTSSEVNGTDSVYPSPELTPYEGGSVVGTTARRKNSIYNGRKRKASMTLFTPRDGDEVVESWLVFNDESDGETSEDTTTGTSAKGDDPWKRPKHSDRPEIRLVSIGPSDYYTTSVHVTTVELSEQDHVDCYDSTERVQLFRRKDNGWIHAPSLLKAGGVGDESLISMILSLESKKVLIRSRAPLSSPPCSSDDDCGSLSNLRFEPSHLNGIWIPLDRARSHARTSSIEHYLGAFLCDNILL